MKRLRIQKNGLVLYEVIKNTKNGLVLYEVIKNTKKRISTV